MLHKITDLNDRLLGHIAQDPVRPHIAVNKRLGLNRDIFALVADDQVQAITCVSYNSVVPTDEHDLFSDQPPRVAVFYTIWSYAPGAGQNLIFQALEWIRDHKKEISRVVTLSPKTDMAHRFHTKNGGWLLQENISTRNYEYLILASRGDNEQRQTKNQTFA